MRVNRSTDNPRSLWFHPDWRYRQAKIHKNEFDRSEGYTLPLWEDDEVIQNLYSFMVSGRCATRSWTELIRLSLECVEWNGMHGFSSRIKTYSVAGLTNREVSEKVGVDEEVVDLFLKIFFDVKDILHNTQRITSVILPFDPREIHDMTALQRREMIWIAGAHMGGEQLADYFTSSRFSRNRAEMDQMMQMIISMLTAQSVEYGVSLRCEGEAKPCHFDKFIAVQDIYSKILGVQAQIDQLNQDRSNTEKLGQFRAFMEGLGVNISVNGEGTKEKLVTDLSISELRNSQSRLESSVLRDRRENTRTRLLEDSGNVTITSSEG